MERGLCEVCNQRLYDWGDDDGVLRCNDCHNHWPANPNPFAKIVKSFEDFNISDIKTD